MCYVCEVCQVIVPPKTPQMRFAIMRTVPKFRVDFVEDRFGVRKGKKTLNGSRREIARELKVCSSCHFGLTSGVSMKRLIEQFRVKPIITQETPQKEKPEVKTVPRKARGLHTKKSYVKNGRPIVIFGQKVSAPSK